MARETFKFEGDRTLEAALKQFARPMAKAAGRRALKKAADPIFDVYRSATTVASGNLVKSETVGNRLNKRQTRLNRKDASKSAVEVHIGTADPAGIQEEFGNRHQAPHPSLSIAWASQGGQKAVDRIGTELAADIEKTAARVARKAAKG
jgi:HK97 gp10 family phage protein